jgi:CRP-like cAMP-binding protein
MQPFQRLSRGDAFGRMACLTGCRHATAAKTVQDTRIWMISARRLGDLARTSPALADSLRGVLAGPEIVIYLQQRQGMSAEDAVRWIERARDCLGQGLAVPPAIKVPEKEEEFASIARRIRRLPVFQNLSPADIKLLSSKVFHKLHAEGHAFFHQNEKAERMYVVEHGQVVLIDPKVAARKPVVLKDGDAFGGMSFLTGARHAVTAMATSEVGVWVLRKSDFEELVQQSRGLSRVIQEFLQRDEVRAYLSEKQEFDAERAARWVRRAVESMGTGSHVIPASEMARDVKQHHGAPLAIWLGILLDGIPESLVIGSSLITSERVSLSLLAGLFISNYPEALSSSVGMRQFGISRLRIFVMWASLMVVTGVGAALGSTFFVGAPDYLFAIVEGVAAGSMLTMIAQTMLPEAYFKGGSLVGIATLLGFLCAIFFSTLR